MEKRVILITGCSSGIGQALAQEMHQRGHLVYATARNTANIQAMAQPGLRVLPLDVTDHASIDAALAVVRHEQGRLDMLINNAGYGQFGAVIDLDPAMLRRQFETNVFAPVALARAALPLLRVRQRACIVNIGSVSGILTTPFAGAYCASKAALHALSDAMRMELAPFGIAVVIVQPGAIASRMGENGAASVALPPDSQYGRIGAAVRSRAVSSQQNATPVGVMAKALTSALLGQTPPPVIRLGRLSFQLPFMRRWLPLSWLDHKLSSTFGLDKLSMGLAHVEPADLTDMSE
jgi:NAD(P)-dependent dehydrogenase (short-subunit alcohol dehydrogenase family)